MIHRAHAALGLAASLWATTAPAEAHMTTHPETGEALAEEQVFTYRLLDEWPSIDPQLVEDTAGFHAARDLFEGLYS